MISRQSIEQLKTSVVITDIIADYVTLKRKGSDYVALCPFHDEKTPSFTVSKSKNLFKCFGCGKSGDAINFVMDHTGKSFSDAITVIAEKYKFPLEQEQNKKFEKPLARLEKVSKKVIDYFEKRGISNNTLLRFGITEAMEWMPVAQKEIQVICFNYFRDAELTNIKFRGVGKDFKLSKNSELIFYNLDALKGHDACVIVEGEIDCLSCHEAGIYNAVSVPNGATTGMQKCEYLDNCWQWFEDKKRIVIFTDNDFPGYNLREELARRLGKHKCFKVEYPQDCKDANDVLIKHGKEKLKSLVDNATEWPIEGIFTMKDLLEDVVNFYENGYPAGIKAGIPEFDDFVSFMPGQYTTITGVPSAGKSEFLDFVMASLAKNHKWGFAVCSFENQPPSIHVTKIIEKLQCKNFDPDPITKMRLSKDEFEYGIFLVDKYFYFININQIEVTLPGILAKAEELVLRRGIKGLVIDPWNYIEHKIPKGYTETQYVSESLSLIKSFASKNGVHVFLVAHPTKVPKDKKSGKYEIPTMYSISGSAHFFNKTDNGITIYRDYSSTVVDVYIQKVRFSWLGKVGFVSFNYNKSTKQYLSNAF